MKMRIAIVEDGALVERDGAGAAVPWWSFTKTVLAAAALALVRDGRLALDACIAERPYTLAQLLHHRAGLANYGGLRAYHEAVGRSEEPWPVATLLERTEANRLRYEPGQGWAYSNIGYLLVRKIIESTSAMSLDAALKHLVLRPLGIERARVAVTPGDLEDVLLGSVDAYHPGWVYHGLLVGPLGDAALLLDRLMTGTLLPLDLRERMQDAFPLGGPVPDRPWHTAGYGLGLMSGATTFGDTATGHTGEGPGSVIAVYHFPDSPARRTVAAFVPGDDAAAVETAAFQRG